MVLVLQHPSYLGRAPSAVAVITVLLTLDITVNRLFINELQHTLEFKVMKQLWYFFYLL